MDARAARFARLSALFDAALDVPAADREAWTREHTGDDPELGAELLRMLAANANDGPLDRPAVPPMPRQSDSGRAIAQRLARALGDRYDIGDEIGRGGMGSVFLAHERKHARDVILKVLRPDAAEAIGRARFEAEVRIAARLAHPHIIPLLDSGDADGMLYFVMPHIPGDTLRARLARAGRMPVPEAIGLLRDIADALAHAHSRGVVHRDIKPENVLCAGGHAFLLDFGVARHSPAGASDESRLTHAGLAIGTPRYMAPEQAAGRDVDHRADLFAWGLVASEMLSGGYDGSFDLANIRDDVPEALAQLIYRCLAPDPRRRPQDAATLVATLDAIQSGASSPPLHTAEHPSAGRRRDAGRSRARRWFVALGAVAVAAAGWWALQATGRVHGEDVPQPIVVVPFDTTVHGRLAATWLTQGLEESQLVQVTPWQAVAQAVQGADDPIAAVRSRLQPGTIVSGQFYETANELALAVEVRRARDDALIVALDPIAVPRDSAMLAIRLARERVMGALAIRRDARFASAAAVIERPPTFEAYRAFDRALTQFNQQQYMTSIDGFRAAFALDSGFIESLVFAAQAVWNTADQDPLLDSLLDHLDARRGELTDYHDYQRLFLRARLDGDGPAALAAAAKAALIAPDSRMAYDAARAALSLGRGAEARQRLEAMSPDRGAMIGWPSYWTNLCNARHLVGDYDAETACAREMRRRHPSTRSARTFEVRAYAAMRNLRVIDSLLADADTLPSDGVYWSLGSMLVVAGDELAAHGDTVAARRFHERAFAWTTARLAHKPDDPAHLYWHASALHSLGRFREAAATFRRLASGLGTDEALEFAAVSATHAGDRNALAGLEPARPSQRSVRLVTEAQVAAVLGDTATARARLAEAKRIGYESWPWLHSTAWRELRGLVE